MFRFLFHLAGHALTFAAGCGLLARFIAPDVLWPPAVIALLLPGLLLLTLVYLLLGALKKQWKYVVFPGLILVAAIPLLPQLLAINFTSPPLPEAAQSVTLLTANIRTLRGDEWEKIEVDEALIFVERSETDVLLLQEASKGKEAQAIAKHLSQALSLDQVHQPKKKTVATLAKSLRQVSASFEGNDYNGFVVTDVATELGTIRIINAHLQSNQITGMASEIGNDRDLENQVNRAGSMFRRYADAAALRAAQADRIRQVINESPHPVILGGDFNDVPSSYTYRKTLTPRLRDAWAEAGLGLGTTFTGPIPGLRIDYLMVDTAFTIHRVERVETGFSDHRGLRVEISH